MRFHKFPQEKGKTIAIDLDRIYAVRQEGENRAWVFYGTDSADQVIGRFDDILALISPPAAPDTFEEDLAKAAIIDVEELRSRAMRRRDEAFGAAAARLKDGLEDRPMTAEEEFPNGAWLNRPMVDAEVRAARLDELKRTVSAFWGDPASFRPRWVQEWTDKRRAEICEGKV